MRERPFAAQNYVQDILVPYLKFKYWSGSSGSLLSYFFILGNLVKNQRLFSSEFFFVFGCEFGSENG